MIASFTKDGKTASIRLFRHRAGNSQMLSPILVQIAPKNICSRVTEKVQMAFQYLSKKKIQQKI